MDPSRPESPAEAKARRIREEAARRRASGDRAGADRPGGDPVAGALRSLPPGWSQVGVVAGERPARVLVGPGGLAVVQAFSPAGPLSLERGVLLEGGAPSAAAAGLLATVAVVRGLAGPAARRTTGVLCVTDDVPALRTADLLVCGAAELVPALTAGPVVLGSGEVAGAGIRLAAALRSARGTHLAGDPEPPPASRVPTVVAVVIAVLLLAALLLLAPRLGEGLGSALGGCPSSSSSC